MHRMQSSRAEPFLPRTAPAADRNQKGKANHSVSAALGQLSRVVRVLPFDPLLAELWAKGLE
jgi:hypothetical protein